MTTQDTDDTLDSYDVHEAEEAHPIDSSKLFQQKHQMYDQVLHALRELDDFSIPECSCLSDAICYAIPSHRGAFHEIVFKLARALRSLDFLEDIGHKHLKSILRVWIQFTTSYLKDVKFISIWSEFIVGWDKVKQPTQADYLRGTFEKAVFLDWSELEVQFEGDEETILLVKFCYLLQVQSKKNDFFLSCRTVGKFFGVDRNTANKWLNMLVKTNVLELAKRGSGYKASRYIYAGDSCSEEQLAEVGITNNTFREHKNGKHKQRAKQSKDNSIPF